MTSFQHTLRATCLVFAVIFASAAVAEQKQKSDQEIADCESRAALQFSVDSAQCAGYPSYSDAYGVCMMNAVTKYTQAFGKCNEASSAALTTLGNGADQGGNGGGKGNKVTGGKSGSVGAGGTSPGGSTGGDSGPKGKGHKLTTLGGSGGTVIY